MHIVELRRFAAEISAVMAQLPTWLDGYQPEPVLFEFSGISGEIRFRLQFRHESAALTFAAVFDGAVLGTGDTVAKPAA